MIDAQSHYELLGEKGYVSMINTPSKDPAYYEMFHKPLLERAKARTQNMPISLVDVACGYCHELDFIQADKDIEVWGVDISNKVLDEARRRLPQARLVEHDVRRDKLPYQEGSIDAAIAVNAVVYSPQDMLNFIFRSLKPGGEAVVNFRNSSNPFNAPFYNHYVSDGATIKEEEVMVGNEKFTLKVLDCNTCKDEKIKALDKQVYFQNESDIERFIRTMGFNMANHQKFHFKSPVNPDNEMDVYTIAKLTS